MRYSPYRCNTDHHSSQKETNIVKEIDLNSADIVPADSYSDRESDDTHQWRDERDRYTIGYPELDRIDRDKDDSDRPSKRMRDYSTMEYMVDIWNEPDQIDDDR